MPNNSFKHLINGLAFKLCFFNYFCCFYFFYLYLISAHDIYDFDENDYQSIFGREKSKSTPLDSHKKSNKLLLIIYILFMSKRKEFVCVKYCVQSCVIVRLKLLTVKKPNDKKTFFYVGLTGFNRIIILNVCKL